MRPKEKKPEGRGNGAQVSHLTNIQAKFSAKGTATEAQRERILQALSRRPQTTEDLRKLGIYQAPARIKELRDRFGYSIHTARITVVDRYGYSHARAALYSLRSEQEGAR